jgi:hypothetical protein
LYAIRWIGFFYWGNRYSQRRKDVWFVGHYGGGKGVISYQKNVIDKLVAQYKLSAEQFFNFFAAPVKPDKNTSMEDTTRTRSFMFFAHAIILGSAIDKDTILYIPENGLISLNIPLTNTRLGSSMHKNYPSVLYGIIAAITNKSWAKNKII